MAKKILKKAQKGMEIPAEGSAPVKRDSSIKKKYDFSETEQNFPSVSREMKPKMTKINQQGFIKNNEPGFKKSPYEKKPVTPPMKKGGSVKKKK